MNVIYEFMNLYIIVVFFNYCLSIISLNQIGYKTQVPDLNLQVTDKFEI